MSERASRMAVLDGGPQDVCPHCGIHRENAGYLQSSCKREHFAKDGCFVSPVGGRSEPAAEAVT